MTSVLSGFADASAWERRADGTIVGRARNGSWAERVRAGVPIDTLVGLEPLVPVDAPAPTLTPATPPSTRCDCDCCGDSWHIARQGYDDAYGRFADWDFDAYFAPVESRRVARARRTGTQLAVKPVKHPKYGPKASKAHTVAARVFAESVEPSVHNTEATDLPAEMPATRPATPVVPAEEQANLLRRYNAIGVILMEWLADMADFADDVEITEEDLELERQLQRQRDHRYER